MYLTLESFHILLVITARLEKEIKLQQLLIIILCVCVCVCDLLKINRRVSRMKNERQDGAKSTLHVILFYSPFVKHQVSRKNAMKLNFSVLHM